MTSAEVAALRANGKKMLARRDDILKRMQELTRGPENEGRKRTPSEESEYLHLDAELCQLDQKLESPAVPVQTSNIRGRSYEEHMFDAARGGAPPNSGVWVDRKTGERVRVLAPGENFADANAEPPYSFGDLVRGLTLGARGENELRAVQDSTIGGGGAMIPSPLAAGLIDAMRAQSVSISLGARTVEMTSKTLDLARVASDPVPKWRDENSDVAGADVTFDRVNLEAKTMSYLVKASRELTEDASNFSEQIQALFARVGAAELDRVVLAGAGVGSPNTYEPLGILNSSDVAERDVSGSPGLVDYDPLLDVTGDILAANGPFPSGIAYDPTAFIMLAKIKQGGTNAPMPPPPALADIPYKLTTALHTGGSPGSGNIVLGDWSQILVGMRVELNVRVLQERYSDKGQIGFWVWHRLDVALLHAKALGRVVGIGG